MDHCLSYVHPQGTGCFHLAFGNRLDPGAYDFRYICPSKNCQGTDAGDKTIDIQNGSKKVVENKYLDQQRCPANKFNIEYR